MSDFTVDLHNTHPDASTVTDAADQLDAKLPHPAVMSECIGTVGDRLDDAMRALIAKRWGVL